MINVCNCGEPDLSCACPRCPRCACALLLSEAGPLCDPCVDLEAPVCNAQRIDLAMYRARDRALYGDWETLRNSTSAAHAWVTNVRPLPTFTVTTNDLVLS